MASAFQFLAERRRLCYPVVLAVAVRAIGSLWLYTVSNVGGVFHTPWMDANPRLIPEWSSVLNPSSSSNWLWLFNAWDSPHFQLVAQLGYQHPDYVYLPSFPIFIRLTGLLLGNYWLAGFLVTQVFALASIVVFQLVAELYMQPKEALSSTLLMSTFPYFSVFTTLSYSEALFLFASLSTWYFYKKGKFLSSAILAGVASVTRIYGLAIVIPILLDLLKSRRYSRLLCLTIPVAFIMSWGVYCYLSTGDPFVSWTDEKYFTSNIASKFGLVQTILNQLFPKLMGATPVPFYIDPPILVALCLFVYLIMKVWQVDRLLSVYTLSVFGAIILVATNQLALLRFLTFIFPIWLTVRVKNLLLVSISIAFFVLVGLLLWFYAINVTFIG